MDGAAGSLGLFVSRSDAQYVGYLECQAERERTAMSSFNLSSEEVVGYKAFN